MLRSVYTKVRGRPVPWSCNVRYLQNASGNSSQDDEEISWTLRRLKEDMIADRERLQWRKSFGNNPGEWTSKFKLFSNEEQTSDFITMMQQPYDFSIKGMRAMWDKRQERIERHMQQYVSKRHEILGSELAAAHFLLYRGGAVKFMNDRQWLRANEHGEFNLPNKFHPDYKVEALRCDNLKIYFEGLENLRCLQHLKFISFHNVKTFDNFCLDRVSGSQYPKLELLDISGTQCTENGLSCLYRIPSLTMLIVDDPKKSLEFELTCAMLEEVIPKLKIVGAAAVHDL